MALLRCLLSLALLFTAATCARAQDPITGTYDLTGTAATSASGTAYQGWGRIRAEGDDLVLEVTVAGADARPPARARAGVSGRWLFREAGASVGLTGALGGGAAGSAPATEVEVTRLASGLQVVRRVAGQVSARERWTPRSAAALAIVALAPERARFVPYRTDGPNTVTVRYAVEPTGVAADVDVTIVDRAGAVVTRRRLPQVTDAGAGLAFTWDGRLADGRCVDARRSPFRVTFTAARGGATATSAPVAVVAVPRVDACFVASRVGAGEASAANKVVAHDAQVTLVAVVRAVVAGARPEEPGRTERVVYVDADGVAAVVLPKVGRVAVARWDAAWPALDVRWQEVRALGLHSESYRLAQNLRRATRHGEFTNVMSNGPTEGQWLGRDTLEYFHVDRGAGPTLAADASPGTVRYRFDADLADAALRLGERAPGTPGRRDPRPTTATDLRSGLLDGFSRDLAGAGPDVHRVSRRGPSAHPLLSHLEAFRGVPWLYGSLGNQVQDYLGYDCADLVFAAARRAGLTTRTQFTNANNLCRIYLRAAGKLPTVRFDEGLRALDLKTGAPVSLRVGPGADDARAGDVVFFDWDGDGDWDHTTVLWEAPSGALDQTARLVWAHHEAGSVDGFYVGTLAELVHAGTQPTVRMVVRRF